MGLCLSFIILQGQGALVELCLSVFMRFGSALGTFAIVECVDYYHDLNRLVWEWFAFAIHSGWSFRPLERDRFVRELQWSFD